MPKDTKNRTDGQVLDLIEKYNKRRLNKDAQRNCLLLPNSRLFWVVKSQAVMQKDPMRAGHQEFQKEQ